MEEMIDIVMEIWIGCYINSLGWTRESKPVFCSVPETMPFHYTAHTVDVTHATQGESGGPEEESLHLSQIQSLISS